VVAVDIPLSLVQAEDLVEAEVRLLVALIFFLVLVPLVKGFQEALGAMFKVLMKLALVVAVALAAQDKMDLWAKTGLKLAVEEVQEFHLQLLDLAHIEQVVVVLELLTVMP
jgi:hypothetical protein